MLQSSSSALGRHRHALCSFSATLAIGGAYSAPRSRLCVRASLKGVKITHWDTQDFNGLQVEEYDARQPGVGEVLVRVTLRPVNPADISLIQGRMGRPPLPLTPGAEGLGIVESCGRNAGAFSPGQRVVCIPSKAWSALDGSGTWQQAMLVPEANLFPVPNDVPDEVAAQFAVNPLTAYALLQSIGDVPAGAWLAQTAAGSVLGRQLASLCRHRGIRLVSVVRRAAQKEELLAAGADAVVATVGADGDATRQILDITGGQGVWASVDCVGGAATRAVSAATRPGGAVIVYGAMSGPTLQLNILDIFLQKRLQPFVLRQWLQQYDNQSREAMLGEVMKLLQDKVIQPFSGKTFPLEGVRAAAAESVRTGRGGKVFLAG